MTGENKTKVSKMESLGGEDLICWWCGNLSFNKPLHRNNDLLKRGLLKYYAYNDWYILQNNPIWYEFYHVSV